jgi:hypothetical protein
MAGVDPESPPPPLEAQLTVEHASAEASTPPSLADWLGPPAPELEPPQRVRAKAPASMANAWAPATTFERRIRIIGFPREN